MSDEIRPKPPSSHEAPDNAGQYAGPWFSAPTAAKYLDFQGQAPVKAFRQWARRHGVATAHRGRCVLFAKADLLVAIGAARGRKRSPTLKPE
jgi:hypothetical protein